MNGRWRSLLYTPADRPERYAKAWSQGVADVVCADLEDATAPQRRPEARRMVLEALREPPGPKTRRAVRINPWGTGDAAADVAAVVPGGPDLLVLPKVEAVRELEELDAAIAAHGGSAQRPGPAVIAILETPRGVLAARELAAGPRVAAVAFGAEDLAAEMGMPRSRENIEVMAARQWVALAAAAAGVPAIDMVTSDFRDLERTALEAREARAWGYRGKMCLHPSQVVAVHEAFRPRPAEVLWAKKVVDAAQEVASGGVVVVDGRMVDVPVIRQARRILEDALA